MLDTNFLLIPAQFGVDIFQEFDRLVTQKFELLIINDVIEELNELATISIKRKKEVQIAFELAKRCKILETNIPEVKLDDTDDAIFHHAVSKKWIVATNDRKLRKKLRTHQIPVIYLRKKAFLAIDGEIPL